MNELCYVNARKLLRNEISSNKVFKVYTIFSKQKLFCIIVHYQLVISVYFYILFVNWHKVFFFFPMFIGCWARLLWKVIMEGSKIKYSKWFINWMAKPCNANMADWKNLVYRNQRVAKPINSVIWKKAN